MEIINNLTNNNHYHNILELFKDSDTAYIISPFLMNSFDDIIYDFKAIGINQIHLITKLIDNDPDLLKKAPALDSFSYACMENDIQYNIYINNKLHGKIYISIKKEKCMGAILSSANFTNHGLSKNHEWGLLINDIDIVEELLNQALKSCVKVSNESIEESIRRIEKFSETNKDTQKDKLDLRISDLLDVNPNVDTDEESINYFFKPMGSEENPFPVTRGIDDNIEVMRFSKRKPSAIHEGDILICYAVGTTKLIGYFKILTEPEKLDCELERWPWVVQVENLCPAYSENWNSYDNTFSKVTDSYNSSEPATIRGGDVIALRGSLQWGSDKVQITRSFAKHLIGIIEGYAFNRSNSSSKFDGLRSYIKKQNTDSLVLTFSKIENLIGKPLCFSARNYDAYWRPSPTHTITRCWVDFGYRTANVNLRDETITLLREKY